MPTSIPHSELLQTLDISASAGTSSWGTESKIDSRSVDKTGVPSTSLKDHIRIRFLINNWDQEKSCHLYSQGWYSASAERSSRSVTFVTICRKDVPCSSFSTLIRDETDGFFGLRALSWIINQKLSYGHMSHYFIVVISCAWCCSSPPAYPVVWSPALFPIEVLLLSKSGKLANPNNYNMEVNCDPEKAMLQASLLGKPFRRSPSPMADPTVNSSAEQSDDESGQKTDPETSHNGPSLQIYYKYDNITRLSVGNRRSWVWHGRTSQ